MVKVKEIIRLIEADGCLHELAGVIDNIRILQSPVL